MKDFVQIWNNVTGRQYAAVNTKDRELGDLPSSRLKRGDVNTSVLEQNLAECEGLNNKFHDDVDFNERKDAIINRLFERRKQGQLTRQPKCLFLILLMGFVGIGTGFFVLFLRPYDFFFQQKITLSDGGEIFEMWRKPEVDLYVKIFLFNVTNSEEYMSGQHDKLKLQEVGPYVYKEALEHKVVKFNDNGTLSAIPMHPLSWVEELSEGNREDDIVYLPHIALLSIANVASSQSFMTRFGLNNLIRMTSSKPLARMTAKEFMMGYKSNLMTLGNTFLPGWIYFDKLGLIDRMYDFNGDYETIFTGETDIRNSGLIDTYKGSTDLPQWHGKHCSNVQYASDGTKFKGEVQKNETLLFFRKSLCRPAPIVPTGEAVKNGLKAYLYTLPDHLLDNGKYIKENKCFCRNGKCLPEGLIDVTDCYYGFPIALSYPHFYKGDDILFSKVEGLTPNKEMHETRFWVEPKSGLPLDVSAKFQINMALEDISGITNTERFANMYLPLLWFDIRMYSLPMSLENRFKVYLIVLPGVEQAVMYIGFIVGAGLIILAVYRLTFKIMFKTMGSNFRKNVVVSSDYWIDKEKNTRSRKCDRDSVYAPCEITLNDNEYDSSEPQTDEKVPTAVKNHQNDRLKELGNLFGEKVGIVRDKVSEVKNVRNLFRTKRSDQSNLNQSYKSDSSDSSERSFDGQYQTVKQSDSDDDFKYLEVIDDGDLIGTVPVNDSSVRSKQLNRLDSRDENIIDTSD